MTRVLDLQKGAAVLVANSSCVATLALMGQNRSERFSFPATSACLKAANMQTLFLTDSFTLVAEMHHIFLVFATQQNVFFNVFFFFIDRENTNKNKLIKKKQVLQAERKNEDEIKK